MLKIDIQLFENACQRFPIRLGLVHAGDTQRNGLVELSNLRGNQDDMYLLKKFINTQIPILNRSQPVVLIDQTVVPSFYV